MVCAFQQWIPNPQATYFFDQTLPLLSYYSFRVQIRQKPKYSINVKVELKMKFGPRRFSYKLFIYIFLFHVKHDEETKHKNARVTTKNNCGNYICSQYFAQPDFISSFMHFIDLPVHRHQPRPKFHKVYFFINSEFFLNEQTA